MNVVLFGATGMIGAGALIECLDDDDVTEVLAVVRRPTGRSHAKLTELVHDDYLDYSAVEEKFKGYDACLYCLGISSAGFSEADDRVITYDYTVAASEVLLKHNPEMRMCFISGDGTDANSRTMWARVKGEAEQYLLQQPYKSAHMFRPAGILPEKGVVSGVASYRFMYKYFSWLMKLMGVFLPHMLTTSPILGRALIRAARDGSAPDIVDGKAINELGA